VKTIIIEKINSGKRLDKFLKKEVIFNEELSRGEIIKLIKNGRVIINGKPSKPSCKLKEGDEVLVKKTERIKQLKANSRIPVKIIFQNQDFAVIDKPSGIAVHSAPGNYANDNTLVSCLLSVFPQTKNVGDDPQQRPGIVHRLDKDTSGLMVIALNQKSYIGLKEQFSERKVSKEYLALVWGHMENKKGVIDQPLARSESYKKQIIAHRKTRTKIHEAQTFYVVEKNYPQFDLVRAIPKTGRTHQIRVHLAYLGHPVIGDKKYLGKRYLKFVQTKRHLLHAQKMSFTLFGKEYAFRSPMPEDMVEYIKSESNSQNQTLDNS